MFCLKEAALNRLVENTTWRPHSPDYLLAIIISSLSSRLLFFQITALQKLLQEEQEKVNALNTTVF